MTAVKEENSYSDMTGEEIFLLIPNVHMCGFVFTCATMTRPDVNIHE